MRKLLSFSLMNLPFVNLSIKLAKELTTEEENSFPLLCILSSETDLHAAEVKQSVKKVKKVLGIKTNKSSIALPARQAALGQGFQNCKCAQRKGWDFGREIPTGSRQFQEEMCLWGQLSSSPVQGETGCLKQKAKKEGEESCRREEKDA